MNRIILSGVVDKDFDLKSSSTGLSVVTLPMKCYNDDSKKSFLFINCIFWRENAENIAAKVSKGTELLLEGKLNIRSGTAKDGKKYYNMEVIGEKFELISNGKQETNNQNYKPQQTNNYQNYDASDVLIYDDDDIPF